MTDGPASVHSDVPEKLRAAFRPYGVFLRGVVVFDSAASAPLLSDGRRAACVALLGNIGGSIWPHFSHWRAAQEDRGGDHPLDTWSKTIIRPIADRFEATPYFPSDPPFQPFQQWAMRAEGLRPSPLGILIHPQYGLWHGYRGALGFAGPFAEQAAPLEADICASCREKPCLSHCPADAILAHGFQYTPCRSHLAGAQGQAGCMQGGCLSRNACPVGVEYRYGADQLRFHMAALSL